MCKRAMLQLRRNILAVDSTKYIQVKADTLFIEGVTFYWNRNRQLMHGYENGADTLARIYGNAISNIDLSFANLLPWLY